MSFELFPHQVTAIDKSREAFRSGRRRVMLQAPVSFGKTIVSAFVLQAAIERGKRCGFVVPRISLIDQTVAKFEMAGITSVGVIQADHPRLNPMAQVQVISEATGRTRGFPDDLSFLVPDEAHMASAKMRLFLTNFPGHVLGLSATPWAKGLGKVYDDLVVGGTMRGLIEAGYMVPTRTYTAQRPDLSGVRKRGGDYVERDLSGAMDKPQVTGDAVSTWLERAPGLPTLVFCVDRAHAETVQQQYLAAGVRAGYWDANTPAEERTRIEREFADRTMPVVVSIGCLTTGVDWDVRCIQFLRPTTNDMLIVQMLGRGLRTAPGKDELIVLDHAGIYVDIFGNVRDPLDIHHEHLSGADWEPSQPSERKEKPPPKQRKCPACTFLKPTGSLECSECGHVEVLKPRETVEVVEGDLVELSNLGKPPKVDTAEKRRWWAGLQFICKAKGYNPGWAANQFRQKFKVWPRLGNVPPSPPDPDVASWVKSRQIAWARSRKRSAA